MDDKTHKELKEIEMSQWRGIYAVCVNDIWLIAYRGDDEGGESWFEANGHTWEEYVGKEQRSILLDASVSVERPIP